MPDPMRKRKRESENESEKEKREIDTFVKARYPFHTLCSPCLNSAPRPADPPRKKLKALKV